MNEQFLLSNLIELQELDNQIFKLISEKSEGTTVKELKTHEIEFKKLQSDKNNIENELQLYFDAKNHIEKSISESQLKIDTINEKLNTNLDASELQNYNLQKQNFEKNLVDYEKSLYELNEENSDELERINKIDQSLESLKPTLLSLSKTLQNEWRDIDLKIGKYEEEKKLLLSSFPEGIIDLYDDLKSKGVEVIAAYKRENQCGCCGVDLTSNEMYEIMNSSFQQCPYCMSCNLMYKIYCDGASRSNPGEASIGVSIQNDEQEVDTISKKIGVATYNVAEYEGLRTALDYCDKNNLKDVQIYLDSLLVVQQVNGRYKVKSKNLKNLYNQCTDLIEKIDNLEIYHVPREQNKRADELANIALDS